MIKVGVLVSGRGTNLQAIMDACAEGWVGAEVAVVISNNPDAPALDRARARNIPAVAIDHRRFPSREPFEDAMLQVLRTHQVDLVCQAGFMRILTGRFVSQYRGRIMNIHPALLPAFGGKGMYGEHVHHAVLESGARVSGCTIHFVNEAVDGGPIILQAVVPVLDDDTPDALAARIVREEHRLYPLAIHLFAHGRLVVEGRRVRILGAPIPPFTAASGSDSASVGATPGGAGASGGTAPGGGPGPVRAEGADPSA
ncbi:MAG: phosphoribosylglycinamide formyltransferase [Armatimonadetes bacterium]|nr:phosphoribosylglycinamide formyltransferase [Armatimonadota bacterium]